MQHSTITVRTTFWRFHPTEELLPENSEAEKHHHHHHQTTTKKTETETKLCDAATDHNGPFNGVPGLYRWPLWLSLDPSVITWGGSRCRFALPDASLQIPEFYWLLNNTEVSLARCSDASRYICAKMYYCMLAGKKGSFRVVTMKFCLTNSAFVRRFVLCAACIVSFSFCLCKFIFGTTIH